MPGSPLRPPHRAPPGTIMMSGCGILTNGKGTRREYCEFSLDELQVTPPGHPKIRGDPFQIRE